MLSVMRCRMVNQLLRLINLVLTTTTLGIAIGERHLEQRHHVLGVVGSSM